MSLALVSPAVVSLSLAAAGTAGERDRLQCLGAVRRDLGSCIKKARERCEGEFRASLPGCFGGPACPGACVDANDRCRELPIVDRDGCRLACQADLKAAIRGCRVADDRAECRGTARVKAVKCRDRCRRAAAPALERCKTTFNDCLRACARTE